MATEQPVTATRRGFWRVLAAVGAGVVLMTLGLKYSSSRPPAGLSAGELAPTLRAVGWINGEAPAPTPAVGSIRVLHAWSTNCVPCIQEAARLVKLQEKYTGEGVEFVGLTYEPPQRLASIQEFLRMTGITWVNGYGGEQTLREFDVAFVPCVWIINSQGQIIWSLDSPQPLAEAIPLALAGKLPAEPAAVP